MHKSEGEMSAKKETINIIEHLLVEEKLSCEDYLMLNRLISVLEGEGISLRIEETKILCK